MAYYIIVRHSILFKKKQLYNTHLFVQVEFVFVIAAITRIKIVQTLGEWLKNTKEWGRLDNVGLIRRITYDVASSEPLDLRLRVARPRKPVSPYESQQNWVSEIPVGPGELIRHVAYRDRKRTVPVDRVRVWERMTIQAG